MNPVIFWILFGAGFCGLLALLTWLFEPRFKDEYPKLKGRE
jgi:hypothetical protein